MPWAVFRVSTRSAFVTAVTRVDSSGVLEAAVATGSWAMASKLPAPLAGTVEQAAPNGPAAAIGDAVVAEAAGVWVPEVSALLLLQAAPKSARPSTPATAARRGVRRRSITGSFRGTVQAVTEVAGGGSDVPMSVRSWLAR